MKGKNMKTNKTQMTGLTLSTLMMTFLMGATVSRADVVGGDDVDPDGEIAHTTVALYQQAQQGGMLCSATLIAKNVAVTAAHCVEHGVDHMAVILGSQIASQNRDVLRVVDAEVSSAWNPSHLGGQDAGDIALVKFEGKLPKGYHAARILPVKTKLEKGDEVILAGYGISNALKKTGAGTLRETNVSVAQPDFGSTEILLDQRHGSGACHGDSGGPAFVMSNGKYDLMGVTSRGYPATAPDDCRQEVVYTRVNAYRAWISQTVKEFERQRR